MNSDVMCEFLDDLVEASCAIRTIGLFLTDPDIGH